MLPISEVIKNLILEYIEEPEHLVIEEESGENTILIRVKTIKNDLAKIIGRNGRNINALNVLVNAIASKRKIRVNLHVIN
jgi:predicted RNA-binding protein YlqC (UPF0109 family)